VENSTFWNTPNLYEKPQIIMMKQAAYCESANLTSTDVLPQQTTTTAVQATTSVDIGIEKPPIVTKKEKVKKRSHHVVYTLPCYSPLIKLIISKFLIEIFTDVPWTLKLINKKMYDNHLIFILSVIVVTALLRTHSLSKLQKTLKIEARYFLRSKFCNSDN
jgi:hypothetical protein